MLIFGHRGSPGRFPENTLPSFEEALRAGVDGFETDLRLLADGAAVLYHDDELGGVDVESQTWSGAAAKGTALPRVSDLAPFAGKTTMILEVKRGGWEERLVEEIAGWPGILVTSFDHTLIAALHRRNVPFPLGIVYCGRIAGAGAYARSVGATWACPGDRYVGRDVVSELHDHGVQVVPWTANRKRDWERLREAGCDGVITDLPAEAVAWRRGLT